VAWYLEQAEGGEQGMPSDADVKEAWLAVNKKSDLWLAVAPKRLGVVRGATKDKETNDALATLLSRCRAVRGTAHFGAAVTAHVVFVADSAEKASEVLAALKKYHGLAELMLKANRPNRYRERLWLRLVAACSVQRRDLEVHVRGTVGAEARE
jgi:hypothetical protein